MTKIARLAAVFALAASAAFAKDKKPTLDISHEVTVTAKVKSVDQKTRHVTLIGSTGDEFTFTADKEIKNLPQLKAGDELTATLVESLKARVMAPGEAIPKGATEAIDLATAPVGSKP